ncbi:PrsW family intramembrane metalloprotease [Nocardioides gilvus]|uniref:PrsW family intramembrane metalloprotease n=1 Tax=Nocardioides gilvus TaxID=1735589 RepID=UPI000D74C463|nr:PrsW family intramembrane metalloprotease [Nocardioides gilvus]
MAGHHRESVVFTVVVSLFALLGAAVVIVVMALSGAPRELVLAGVLAFLPVGPLVACYMWLDRYEPEPRMLLAMGLVWGACVATAAAILLQGIGGIVAGVGETALIAVAAPITEEATKGAFLLLMLWWRRGELDGILDGIVYAGMVGIGFAFVENILYLAAAYNGTDGMGPGGTEALTSTFIIRCLVSPFAHPLFTAFIGIGAGIAVGSRTRGGRFLALSTGYAMAVFTHALWNSAALGLTGNFVVVYVTLMAPLFLAVSVFAVWLRRSERRMLTAALHDAAARGLLPASDIGWLVNLGSRRVARRHARGLGGERAQEAMEEYQQAAVELGFLHHRYLRGTPPPDFAARGQSFVVRLNAVRPYISFPGQVVPTR